VTIYERAASYQADPERNERILFFVSLGGVAFAGLMFLAVLGYSAI
jgi:hypothetical protein